jgi:hypothetical protein
MPLTQSDLEIAQVKTILEARGWRINLALSLKSGLRLDASRAPVEAPYDTGPLKDLTQPPTPPRP